MKLNDFINEFNKAESKVDCLKNHVVNTYVPVTEKMNTCIRIVDASTQTVIDGVQYFKDNSMSREILLKINQFDQYTDIDVDWDNVVETYDMLAQNKVFDWWGLGMPDDILVYDYVMDQTYADKISNERNIVSYLDTKWVAIVKILDVLLENMPKE